MVSTKVLIEKRPVRWGWLVVATVLAVAALGVLLSVRALRPASDPPRQSFAIGDDVPTSFGVVAVEFVRSVDGLTHRALAGATHGVSGFVGDGKRQIQVAVALTNTGHQPLGYTVRQFRLTATAKGKATVLPATAGDLPDARILPNAGIEGHLDFTVPASTSAISLAFRDPGRSAPVVIDLGTLTPTAPGSGHHHG